MFAVLAGEGCPAWDPVCNATTAVAGTAATAASDVVLTGLGRSFLAAAEQATALAMSALDSSTGVDLSVAWFRANVAVIAAVTLPMVVGLLVAQVVGSVIRREPGGLARAVVGVAKALVGASLALAVTQLALSAVDGICEFIASSAGLTVATAAAKFLNVAAWAATSPTPVLSMLIGLAVIVGCVLLWGVMLFRKAALILVAVFAPVAFAGQVWDQTRVWTRRWLEVVAALVLCKVVIVVVFVVGASAFTGTGPGGAGVADGASGVAGLSDLLVGLLLLAIAVFAPWLTWRFVHWSGMEAAAVMHSAVAANPVTSGVRNAGTQARYVGQQVLTSMVLGGAGGAAREAAGAGAGRAAGGGGGPRLSPPPAPPATGGGRP